jgi:hypothetical protein
MLIGFAVACLAASVTLVLFVYTPVEFASLPAGMARGRLLEAALFALAVTPHVALFAGLFALIGASLAESRNIDGWSYYLLTGVGIAALGFLAQHLSEPPNEPTILQNYALAAFLTAGGVGGLAYWLCSGRYAGPARPPAPAGRPPASETGSGDAAATGAADPAR